MAGITSKFYHNLRIMDIYWKEKDIDIKLIDSSKNSDIVNIRAVKRDHVESIKAIYTGNKERIHVVWHSKFKKYLICDGRHIYRAHLGLLNQGRIKFREYPCQVMVDKNGNKLDAKNKQVRFLAKQFGYRNNTKRGMTFIDNLTMIKEIGNEFLEENNGNTKGMYEYLADKQWNYRILKGSTAAYMWRIQKELTDKGLWEQAFTERWNQKKVKNMLKNKPPEYVTVSIRILPKYRDIVEEKRYDPLFWSGLLIDKETKRKIKNIMDETWKSEDDVIDSEIDRSNKKNKKKISKK